MSLNINESNTSKNIYKVDSKGSQIKPETRF